MKKVLSLTHLFFALFLCLLTVSCSEDSSLLEYQKSGFSLNAVLCIKDSSREYGVCITKSQSDNTVTLSFEEGEALESVTFVLKDGKVSAFCGDDLYESTDFSTARSVLSLFDLKEEDFISAETDSSGQTRLNVLTFKDGVRLTFAKDRSIPLVLENDEVRITVRV